MLDFIYLSVALGAIVAFLSFLFQPYFNWKKQMKIARSLKSKDNLQVITHGRTYVYKDYLNSVKNESIELSIVIPAYNEESRLGKTLSETIEFFDKKDYEIIVVVDAAKDKTKEVALSYTQYAGKKVPLVVIDSPVNKGKGGAVRLGMLIARGEKVLMMDADLATDLTGYEPCNRQLEKIKKNGLGIITGSRKHFSAEVQAKRKFHRKIISGVSSFIVNVICGIGLRDTQCGFKLFTKNTAQLVFRTLHLERWAFDVEIFMIAKHLKAPFAECPVSWHDVEGSHLNVVTASITMARDFLLVRILYLTNLWKWTDDIGL